MFEEIQVAIIIGFFLSFMIGPVFFVLLETSALRGFRAGVSFNIGVFIADIIFLFLAYFSSYQLLENLSNQPGLYVFGGTLLTGYGLVIFFKKPKEVFDESGVINIGKTNYLGLMVKGFLLNFINIGVLAFWMVLMITFGPKAEKNPKQFLAFFGIMMATYFIVDLFKILLAKRLKKKLNASRILLIKKILGVLLISCGVILIVNGFLPKDQTNIKKGIDRIRRN